MPGPVIKSKSNALRSHKNYNKKTASWTMESVKRNSLEQRQKEYEWFLTPEQSWDGNYNGATAYVHSTVKSFYKNIHAHNLLQSVESTIRNSAARLQNELDNIQKQVEPKQEWRDQQILNMFKKGYIEDTFDGIKEVLLSFTQSEVYKNYKTFKTNALSKPKAGEEKKWVSLTFGGKDATVVHISKIKTQKVAVQNFKKYLLEFLFITPEDSRYPVIDQIGDSIDSINWEELDNIIYADPEQKFTITTPSGKTISLANAIQELQNVLTQLTNIQGSRKSYQKLCDIQTLAQAFAMGRSLWSNMGLVYEDIVNLARKELGYHSTVVSQGELRKHNTTDIMIQNFTKDLESTIGTIKTQLGVTLKQTINFEKESSLDYSKVKQWLDGDADTLLKQYKYFMLNYACLGDIEFKERKSTRAKDDNLLSHTEIVALYQLFNTYIGRIFLIQGLIGNLLNNTTHRTFAEDGVIPAVLVTQEYALFTFDVLQKMEELLQTGDIMIEIPFLKTPADFYNLVNTKAELAKTATNYDPIVHDDKVKQYISSINRSAFNSTDAASGQMGIIKMRTTINLAAIMEKVNGYNRVHNTFF